jgi:hypothetical protein
LGDYTLDVLVQGINGMMVYGLPHQRLKNILKKYQRSAGAD